MTQTADVIVVGASLPHMDGLEVCRQLRLLGFSDSTPIIMTTTARPSRADRLAALDHSYAQARDREIGRAVGVPRCHLRGKAA